MAPPAEGKALFAFTCFLGPFGLRKLFRFRGGGYSNCFGSSAKIGGWIVFLPSPLRANLHSSMEPHDCLENRYYWKLASRLNMDKTPSSINQKDHLWKFPHEEPMEADLPG